MEIIFFIAGFIMGAWGVFLFTKRAFLLVDHSDPEKDVYRLDIGNLDNIERTKYVMLRVINDADLSQE